jgi:uncharacterized membrane protein
MKKKIRIVSVIGTLILAAAQLLGPKVAPVIQAIVPNVVEVVNYAIIVLSGGALVTDSE